ncbi:MAG: penicillin-binding protein, partial [Chloroflexi bacterium]
TPQQPQLDPQVRALAQRYLDTEQQVHTLRQMHAVGQITREDLQERLRNLMVLDENQTYWMLGINSDQWYKFENNQWVPATPPALEALRRFEQPAQPQTGAPRTETGQLPVVDELPSGSLPYMPSSTGVESGTSQMYAGYDEEEGATRRFDESQPLPRQVPKRDPDMTTVTPAAFRDHIPTGSEPTVVSQPAVSGYDDYSAPTVATGIPAVGTLGDEPVIEQPYGDEVPDYDAEQAGPIYQQVVEQQRRSMTSILIFALIGLLGCGFLTGAGIVAAGLVWYNGLVSPYEQSIAELGNYQPPPNTVRVLDAEGGLIAELIKGDAGGARTEVDLEEVSPWMIHAVLSTENERFYDDPGWDLFAIVRAFIQNFTSGEIESGASTITQQIARNLVLQSTEATATRKINEIVVANQIAQQYDKNFILSLYLNEFSFGNQSLGVEEAARFYFNKPAAELNLAEAALLAGIIQAPSEFNPVINRERAFERMESIIDRMFEVGCIQFRHGDWPQRGEFCVTPETMVEVPGFDQPQRLAVFNEDGELVGGVLVAWMGEVKARQYLPREVEVKYPHFVNLVRARVEAEFGEETMFSEGFIIHTTLIPRVQNAAENALTSAMQRVITTGVNNGAVMVIDPVSGAIRALVGSADFSNVEIDGQVDNTRAWHQPGSSIKPILYTAALLGGDFNADGNISFSEYLTPVSILWDVPSDYNGYRPVNYDRRFHGPVSLRVALQNSYNVPAVKVMSFIGTQHFVDVAKRMGLQFQDNAQFNLTTALGSTEVRLFDMVRAYATIANGGQNVPLYVIDRITDMDGNPIDWNDRGTPEQAIPPQVAYLMADILTDDNARAAAFGTNSALTLADIGYPTDQYVGAKTGTSDDGRDLWTMGFTKTAVVGVWMGRSDNQPTFNTSGFLTAAPVWHEVMVAAVQGASPQVFQPVSGIVSREVCLITGTLADESCLNRTFEEVWEQRLPPPPDQGFVKEVAIDTWTQLLSNQFCPEFT